MSSPRQAQLGTNLTPDGVASNSTDVVSVAVDPTIPSVGACYVWPGTVSVRSTLAYDVTVVAAAANARLHFLTASPPNFAACVAGEAVGTAMFPGAIPAGAWVTNQSATAARTHSYWLGLDVRWTTPPSTTLGNATLTIRAFVHW